MSSLFGYCPICGAEGRSRERRYNGNDICIGGHIYPSGQALKEISISKDWISIYLAPKDGTELLLCDINGVRVVGRWSKYNHVPLYGWVYQVDLKGEEVTTFDAVWYQLLPKAPV